MSVKSNQQLLWFWFYYHLRLAEYLVSKWFHFATIDENRSILGQLTVISDSLVTYLMTVRMLRPTQDSRVKFSRRGQTTPLMFHEGYICLVYIFLNQVWQMSFLCSPVYFNLEVVTKRQIMTS